MVTRGGFFLFFCFLIKKKKERKKKGLRLPTTRDASWWLEQRIEGRKGCRMKEEVKRKKKGRRRQFGRGWGRWEKDVPRNQIFNFNCNLVVPFAVLRVGSLR